jgi:hypothetical protein
MRFSFAEKVDVLNPMSAEEGERAGVPNHRSFFSVCGDKENFGTTTSGSGLWYQLVNVCIDNSPAGLMALIESDSVGVPVPWKWPALKEATEGVTSEQIEPAPEICTGR